MKLSESVKNIKNKRILVIGDVMLDRYYIGKSTRISPEAPIPILLEDTTRSVLGGAANVALNLVTANQFVSLMSVIGDDLNGLEIKKILNEKKVDSSLIAIDEKRCTIVKNRFIGQNNMQMFRLDQEMIKPIDDEITNKLLKKFENIIDDYDLVIISDYNKGFLTVFNTPKFINVANRHNKKVLIDIKEPVYDKYRNAYLIKPNVNELSMITGMKCDDEEKIKNAAKILQLNTNSNYVLVTLGKDGMMLVNGDDVKKIDCVSKEVYDVTGAGDTVIAYMACAIANNIDIIDSANISSYAAGVKVSKMGTYAVTLDDILDYITDSNNVLEKDKIISANKLGKLLENRGDKKVVFTNGCFDIFHVGHLRYLKETSKLGDIMVIGLNSDKSVKRLKGDKRPIVPEDERSELLASLEFVSYVVLFDEDTPYEIIKKIQPDIITKGGDYNPNDVVGKDIVEKNGGNVIICPLVENKSTTNIIDKILEVYHE